jgi:hypothetical protein
MKSATKTSSRTTIDALTNLKAVSTKNGNGVLMTHTSITGERMYKVFQQRDFNKYDEAARAAAKRFWSSVGYTCADNPDEYGVDLVVKGQNKMFFCEVEVKTVWHGVQFKYPTIHLPVRKAKFLTKPTQFMIFNNSLTHAALFGRKVVLDSPCVEVSNVKISHGEKFFDVPFEKATFVQTI